MTEYWVSQGKKWCDFCKTYIANNPLSIRTHELGQRHKDNVAKRLATMRKESSAREKEQKEAARALKEIVAKAKKSYQNDLASFQRVDTSDGLQSNKTITDEALCSAATRNEAGAPGLVISTPLNPMRAVKGAQSSVTVKRRKMDDEKAKVISKEEAEALKAMEAATKRMEESHTDISFVKQNHFIYCIEWYVTLCLFDWASNERTTTSQYNPCHVICSCLVLISHMKLAVQEFCISPQSAVPHSKSRSYVWTLFKASMALLLFQPLSLSPREVVKEIR
uniref:Matrin-type domain-containing protein n=1 Tax=Musa acuminata subsp. malaccensis TaxID=214687 RepID=A0A804JXS6_MUSAM|nr:PREDICTED: zinc finger protein ZOP1-like isoform X2 [Musa acuminata subsp. malaccensis]